MLITSTKAMILIILSLIILSLMAALIARYPFALLLAMESAQVVTLKSG